MGNDNDLVKYGTSSSECSNMKLIMSDPDISKINTIAKMNVFLSYSRLYKSDVNRRPFR